MFDFVWILFIHSYRSVVLNEGDIAPPPVGGEVSLGGIELVLGGKGAVNLC